jgi:hypothetical protein
LALAGQVLQTLKFEAATEITLCSLGLLLSVAAVAGVHRIEMVRLVGLEAVLVSVQFYQVVALALRILTRVMLVETLLPTAVVAVVVVAPLLVRLEQHPRQETVVLA